MQALMTAGTVKGAAKKLHCDERTIRRRKNKPEIQAMLQAAMHEVTEEYTRRFTQGAGLAIATIENILTDEDTPINARIRAAGLYLQMGLQYRQCNDLLQQIERLQYDFDQLKKDIDRQKRT